MDTLIQDLGYAVRQLRRSPGFALVAVLTLGLGIGANSAIFSIVNSVVLRPLPYAEPDRLVAAQWGMRGEYMVLRENTRTLDELALYRGAQGFNLSVDGGAERVTGAHASTNLFSTLGVQAALGRTFLAGEEQLGESNVVLLSDALWRQRFASDPSVVGREIPVDGEPRTVVGIMPPGFDFPASGTALWVPIPIDPADPVALWGGDGGNVIGRLAHGTTPEQAQAELRALAPLLHEANTLWRPEPGWGTQRAVAPLHQQLVGDVRTRLLILLGAVGFVLLIACVNVANLLLARGIARRREVAVRNALGAGRRRIAQQLLTESTLLGLLGGALGLLLVFASLQLLLAGLPADTPRMSEIRIDGWVLGFTLGISLLTGLAFGAMPALRSARIDLQSALRNGSRGAGGTVGRAAAVLVSGELALAVLLVIGAGLLIRSFAELTRVDPGFRPESLVTARVTAPETRYTDAATRRAFYGELLDRIAALPDVQAVEAVNQLPLVGEFTSFAFEVESDPYVPGTAAQTTDERRVTPGYTQLMGIPLLRGRPLSDADREGTPRVALINEVMAEQFWPGEDPIGKRFKEVWLEEWTTVVGVVGNVRHHGLAREPEPEIYRPFAQLPIGQMSLVVRTAGDAGALAANLRGVVSSIDPDAAVSQIRTARQLVSVSVAEPRFTTLLLSAFATLALTLAAVGIYGTMAQAVNRRTREIGVRMALGARGGDVLRMVLRQAAKLAGVGVVIGIGGALAGTRVLSTLLYGVGTLDPVTFMTVPILLFGVALLATYLPARRAARVDPMVALRSE